jgi:hypothetical protein
VALDLYSTFRFCTALFDDQDRLYLTERVPFLYRPLADNRAHVARDGDRLWYLASAYFAPRVYAAQLWYVIADFQVGSDGTTPQPIHDPTIPLEVGSIVWIPSLATLDTQILNERRRAEFDDGANLGQ